MKINFIFIVLLFNSCTDSKFSGYVYDYDSEQPIKNVQVNINQNKTQTDSTGYFSLKVNSNTSCSIFLSKKGYAAKKVYRKPDSSDELSKRNLNNNTIYLYDKESDFSKKIKQ